MRYKIPDSVSRVARRHSWGRATARRRIVAFAKDHGFTILEAIECLMVIQPRKLGENLILQF